MAGASMKFPEAVEAGAAARHQSICRCGDGPHDADREVARIILNAAAPLIYTEGLAAGGKATADAAAAAIGELLEDARARWRREG
jgi:hypothetical protein